MDFDVTRPEVRAVLIAARSWGVSPSRFLGECPETTTVHHRDESGRVTRSVSVTGPEWSDDDRNAAMALATYEAELCPGCRQPMSETTDPAHEIAYVADLPIRCHRCTESDRAGELYQDSPRPSALMIPIRLEPSRVTSRGSGR